MWIWPAVAQPLNDSKGTSAGTSAGNSAGTRSVSVDEALNELEILERIVDEALADEVFANEIMQSVEVNNGQGNRTAVDAGSLIDADEPEILLNQLDESDLMDFVAEDDLWKEELLEDDLF